VSGIADALFTGSYPPLRQPARPHRRFEEALLYSNLAVATGDKQWGNRAVQCLNEAIDGARSLRDNLGLYGGLCGLGWVVAHLAQTLSGVAEQAEDVDQTGEEDPVEDLTQEIDELLLRRLRASTWQGPYDLISGLVGFGVYFLERLPSESAEAGIRLVVQHLEDTAEHQASGTTWYSSPESLPEWQRELCPEGYYNLGVAHGIPCVVYMLGEACALELEAERSYRLLEGAVTWLIAHQRPSGSLSRFSGWIATGASSDSRLAWCYGDLGIAAVLLRVAHRAGRADWREFALSLVDHCLSWPLNRSKVNDAPLCHGAAGVAHIFNRIFQLEGDIRCRDAAIEWFDRALSMRLETGGVSGFVAYAKAGDGPVVWQPSPAFLDGALGIALSLQAALTTTAPEWDRQLLLSGREDIQTARIPGKMASQRPANDLMRHSVSAVGQRNS
jgi:hypothetical protein